MNKAAVVIALLVGIAVGAGVVWALRSGGPSPQGTAVLGVQHTGEVPTGEESKAPLVWVRLPNKTGQPPPAWAVFYGQHYDPPLEVKPIASRDQWDRSTPEKSFFGISAANRKGDRDWILAGFVPDEREEMGRLVHGEMLKKNTEEYNKVEHEYILDRLEFGPYRILLIKMVDKDGSVFAKRTVFKKTEEGWLQTNSLRADPVVSGVILVMLQRYQSSQP